MEDEECTKTQEKQCTDLNEQKGRLKKRKKYSIFKFSLEQLASFETDKVGQHRHTNNPSMYL